MKRRNKKQSRSICPRSHCIGGLAVLVTIAGSDLRRKQDAYAMQKAELEMQFKRRRKERRAGRIKKICTDRLLCGKVSTRQLVWYIAMKFY